MSSFIPTGHTGLLASRETPSGLPVAVPTTKQDEQSDRAERNGDNDVKYQ
nr:MAG TPA: hypothetical protein [Caudoviricetes sp.]